MIQPTLFEGGPGGFCVWRAIDLSKKIACSNISINEELKAYVENIYFFNPYSKKEIKDALYKLLIGPLNSSELKDKDSINYQFEYAKSIIYN